MATEIGAIKARMELSTDNFKRGVEKAKQEMRELGNDADKAKRKFEGLESALTAIASTAAFSKLRSAIKDVIAESDKLYNSMTGLIEVAKGVGQSVDDATALAQRFAEEGLMNIADSANAVKTALSMGLDLKQTEQLVRGLADAAAFNRAAHLSMSEAISQGVQAIKMGNSELLDNTGLTRNLSSMYADFAKQIGTTADKLTDQQKAQAALNGVLADSALFAGNAQKALEGYAGTVNKFDSSIQSAKASLGDGLKPVVQEVMNVLTPVITEFSKWASENKEVIAGIAGAGVTVTGLIAILSTATIAVRGLKTAFEALNTSIGRFGVALSIIGLATAAILAYKSASDVATGSTMEQIQAQRDQIAELDNLIARFDELKDKPNKTAEELAELRDVQNELVKINPTLADGYDEVGNAMLKTSEKAKELSENMKEVMRAQAYSAYVDAIAKVREEEEKLGELREQMHKREQDMNEESAAFQNRVRLEMARNWKSEEEARKAAQEYLAQALKNTADQVAKQDDYVRKLYESIDAWKKLNREIGISETQTSEYLAAEKLAILKRNRQGKKEDTGDKGGGGGTSGTGTRKKTPEEIAAAYFMESISSFEFKWDITRRGRLSCR